MFVVPHEHERAHPMGDDGVEWPSDVVAGHYVGGRTFVAAQIALPSNGEAEKSDSASDDSPGHA